jgi:hypothetical protein
VAKLVDRHQAGRSRWLAGEADVGRYGFHPESKNAHVFCRNCGVRIGMTGYVEEIGGA